MKGIANKLSNKLVEEKLEKRLFVTNEYGFKHQHFDQISVTNAELNYLKEQGFKTEYDYGDSKVPLHPMCISCQARHILKYKDSHLGQDKPFQIKCKGVPSQAPPGAEQIIKRAATEKGMSLQRATKLVTASFDPVAWAELMFGFDDSTKDTDEPWYLRPYQKEALRCSSKRIALRQGRRTGKTMIMAIKLLYHALNTTVSRGRDSEGNEVKAGPQIIISTPFQAQLDNVFTEMERLLKRNVDLTARITSEHAGSLFVKSPFFKMTFDNDGIISGFVTGVEVRQDGSAGGSMRGQSAQIVYIDEMDMIPEEVLRKVIIPILFTSPNTTFYASSTPIGKAGEFHNICKDRPDFKEIYLPSTVLPHWETEKKELGKIDPQDDGFISEYMAEFIDSSAGVFKAQYVYNSMSNYEYQESQPENGEWYRKYAKVHDRKELLTCIGIDWNKNAGSEFVVVRYDVRSNKWWVVDAVNVPASQFSGVRFKEEVKRLNYTWRPADGAALFIYADEGYGHHIIDDLMWESQNVRINQNNPKAKMSVLDQQTMFIMDRLKKFNFSQKVELTNPIDGTIFQRTGKEFLVENAVRVFESGRLSFPANDEALKQQLLNYIVARRHASNGRPVYGMRSDKVGDHRLDALMLALGGIFLEGNPVYSLNNRMGKSMPGLLEKDTLVNRFEKHGKTDDDLLSIQPGVSINSLIIKRDPLTDPDDIRSMNKSKFEFNFNKSPEAKRGEFGSEGKVISLLEASIRKSSSKKNRSKGSSIQIPNHLNSKDDPFVRMKRR